MKQFGFHNHLDLLACDDHNSYVPQQSTHFLWFAASHSTKQLNTYMLMQLHTFVFGLVTSDIHFKKLPEDLFHH